MKEQAALQNRFKPHLAKFKKLQFFKNQLAISCDKCYNEGTISCKRRFLYAEKKNSVHFY